MKRFATSALLLVSLIAVCCAGRPPHVVMFYNLENLFDTINDPNVNDEEFLPDGEMQWTGDKYRSKLANIERVFCDMAELHDEFPAIIGVAEVENRGVLEDLIAQDRLKEAGYGIVHYDSPDKRGIDCAFLYRPDVFKLAGSKPEPYAHPKHKEVYTRDIVTMWGTIEGEPFLFMVAHWPSRRGGKDKSSPLREHAALRCKQIADSVRRENPSVKVVIMGDLNDDATDKSIVEVLGAKGKPEQTEENGFYNPFIDVFNAGYGTLAYGNNWNLFDNIIVSGNLATASDGGLRIQKADSTEFYGNIFSRQYMFQRKGAYRGYPLRTFSGRKFQNGFSDHLPVYIYISK